MTELLHILFNGMLTMAFAVAAAFFWRFWRQTGDRLFVIFALSFLVLAVNRVALTLTPYAVEWRTYLYLIRLAAFVLILYAIIDKNLPRQA